MVKERRKEMLYSRNKNSTLFTSEMYKKLQKRQSDNLGDNEQRNIEVRYVMSGG